MDKKKRKAPLSRVRDGFTERRATENTPWRKLSEPYSDQRLRWDLHFDIMARVSKLENAVKEITH